MGDFEWKSAKMYRNYNVFRGGGNYSNTGSKVGQWIDVELMK